MENGTKEAVRVSAGVIADLTAEFMDCRPEVFELAGAFPAERLLAVLSEREVELLSKMAVVSMALVVESVNLDLGEFE